MTPQEERQVLSNMALFLKRAKLDGHEVPAFNEVMQYVGQRLQALEAVLAEPEKAGGTE